MRSLPLSLAPSTPLLPRADDGGPGEPYPSSNQFPWSHLALSLALLAIAGASFGLFLATLSLPGDSMEALFQKNSLPKPFRNALLQSVLFG
ncbi:MAG: hypothetical protein RMJ98_09045, partial [Myxococcales bacterium]|nr:hypothetical protein [Polyangiaceae bacterium]MDW8249432.1 hypothetical protein [Myxococcales bacterium]